MFLRRNKNRALIPTSGKQPVKFFKRRWVRVTLLILGILLLFAIAWLVSAYTLASKIFTSDFSGSQILKLLSGNNDQLKGQSDGRVNILLLGYGGSGHDGAYLTDTIQVASINTKTNKIAMISIPRDLYVEMKKPRYAGKINAVYELQSNGTYASKISDCNPDQIKNEIGTIMGIPIHYYVSLDFSGFKKIIDSIGGIDINVPVSFTDYEYPADTGNGYMPAQKFTAGGQHMNGARALIYARSRHAAGSEGSDFARSQRQQQVMVAVKEKLASNGILANPAKLLSLIDTVSSSLRTDLQPTEIKALGTLIKDVDTSNPITRVLDNSTDGLLTLIPGTSSYQPKAGLNDFSQIQEMAKNIFDNTNSQNDQATIVILNGSKTAGLTLSLRDKLTNSGYNIVAVAKTTITTSTVIYNFSDDSHKTTLDYLKNKLDTNVSSGKGKIDNNWNADIIIVLGNDYQG